MARAFSLSTPNENLAIDLSRALARLEQKILASPQNSRLYYSRSERTKTAAVGSPSNALFPSLSPDICALESRICPWLTPSSWTQVILHQDPIPQTSGANQTLQSTRSAQNFNGSPSRTRPTRRIRCVLFRKSLRQCLHYNHWAPYFVPIFTFPLPSERFSRTLTSQSLEPLADDSSWSPLPPLHYTSFWLSVRGSSGLDNISAISCNYA